MGWEWMGLGLGLGLGSKGRSKVDAAEGAYKAIAAGARRRWERGFVYELL